MVGVENVQKNSLHFILYLRSFPVETVVVILAYFGLGSLSSWLPVLLVLLGLRSLESSSLESSLKASAALKNHRSGHYINPIYVGLLPTLALEEHSFSSKALQERPRRKLLEGTQDILPNAFFTKKS